MLLNFYLTKYKNYSLVDLFRLLNEGKKSLSYSEAFIVCTLICHRQSKRLYNKHSWLRDYDSLASFAIEIFIYSYIGKKKINGFVIERIFREETTLQINWVANLTASKISDDPIRYADIAPVYDKKALWENIERNNRKLEGFLHLDDWKDSIMEVTPDRLKLYMFMFLQVLTDSSNLYSDSDRHIINTILLDNNFKVEIHGMNILDKLETLHEKALFLTVLSLEYPVLFILLTSTNDINRFLLLFQYDTGLPKLYDVVHQLEDAVNKVKILLSEKTLPDKILVSMAEKINFVFETTNLVDILNRELDRTADEFDEALGKAINSANNNGNLMRLGKIVDSEMKQSLALVESLKKSGVGESVFTKNNLK